MKSSLIHNKISAATLPEVLVSLVIVTIILGISMATYLNVIRSSYHTQKIKAIHLLEQKAAVTKEQKEYTEQQEEQEGMVIYRKILPCNYSNELLELSLKAEDQEKNILAEYHELITRE